MSNVKHLILVVEDDPQIRKFLRIALESEGYHYIEAENGREALRLSSSRKPSLVLLDLGLPDMDGMDVLEMIKNVSNLPVIICSVRNEDKDILAAFHSGADDYINKPFNPDLLLARVAANIRQSVTTKDEGILLSNGSIILDQVAHNVACNDKKLDLTPKEFTLLALLLKNKGKVITHKEILREIWGAAHAEDVQYLRVYIRQLREKLGGETLESQSIRTESGIGYRMEIL